MADISKRTERKGYWLYKQNMVEKQIETDRRIHFAVKTTHVKEHFVIFDKKKKEFSCDCQFYSLHLRPCSHILAAKMCLEDKDKKV